MNEILVQLMKDCCGSRDVVTADGEFAKTIVDRYEALNDRLAVSHARNLLADADVVLAVLSDDDRFATMDLSRHAGHCMAIGIMLSASPLMAAKSAGAQMAQFAGSLTPNKIDQAEIRKVRRILTELAKDLADFVASKTAAPGA